MTENIEYTKKHFPPLNQTNNKIPEELSNDVIYTINPITDMHKKLSHKHLFIWYKTNIDHNSLKTFIQSKRRKPLEKIIIADFICRDNTTTGLYVNFGSSYRTNNLNTLIYPGEYENFSPHVYTLNSSSIRSPLLTFIWYNKSYSDMKYDLCAGSKLGCCKSYIKYIKNNNTINVDKQDPEPETNTVNEIKQPIPVNPVSTPISSNVTKPVFGTPVTNLTSNATPKNTSFRQNYNSRFGQSKAALTKQTFGTSQKAPQQKQVKRAPPGYNNVGTVSCGGKNYDQYYNPNTSETLNIEQQD